MSVSKDTALAMESGSWIRKMFEEGLRMAREIGKENVFDFSIGNPDVPPPPEFQRVLMEEAARETPGIHAYMPNAGFEATRQAVADWYRRDTGLSFQAANVVMTSGAGGALNVIMKSILDPGDEVIVLSPYFVEYRFYITNHGGQMVLVPTDEAFLPDIQRIGDALTTRTRALILNSPNNPTGVVYPPESLTALAALLTEHSRKVSRPVYLISDEPYRRIIYGGLSYPSPFLYYDQTVVATSHSKDLGLAGERIGHIAVSPRLFGGDRFMAAAIFCNRILGFINANALMQRVIARIMDVTVDTRVYERRRDRLCEALSGMGYQFVKPQGAFYLFPKSPLADDLEFVSFMQKHHVIVTPGRGFHGPGYFRISYAVPDQTIERSLPYFEQAAKELGVMV